MHEGIVKAILNLGTKEFSRGSETFYYSRIGSDLTTSGPLGFIGRPKVPEELTPTHKSVIKKLEVVTAETQPKELTPPNDGVFRIDESHYRPIQPLDTILSA